MANAMYLAGFDVKDVHMTDLIFNEIRRYSYDRISRRVF